MSTRINNNISALNSLRNMSILSGQKAKAMEKLSSGQAINRAADNAAGLAISEKMRGQIRGLDQASSNAQDSISLIQTAEGALNETHSILQRMRELAVQAANDTNTDADRAEIQKEADQLTSEINRIGNTTEFNTKKLLNGTVSTDVAKSGYTRGGIDMAESVTITTGSNDTLTVNVDGGGATTLTLDAGTYTRAQLVAEVQSELDDGTLAATASLEGGTLQITSDSTGTTSSISITGGTAATALGLGTAGLNTVQAGTAAVDNQLTMQIGANNGQTMGISISDMRAKALGIAGTAGAATGSVAGAIFTSSNTVTDGTTSTTVEASLDLSDSDKATSAIEVLDDAITTVSAERSKLGAYQNRLEHTINNLDVASENIQSAESRIRDVDMAEAVLESTRVSTLSQAAQAMLAQANQEPQQVLQLLQQ